MLNIHAFIDEFQKYKHFMAIKWGYLSNNYLIGK
jgi:hypothetical protein